MNSRLARAISGRSSTSVVVPFVPDRPKPQVAQGQKGGTRRVQGGYRDKNSWSDRHFTSVMPCSPQTCDGAAKDGANVMPWMRSARDSRGRLPPNKPTASLPGMIVCGEPAPQPQVPAIAGGRFPQNRPQPKMPANAGCPVRQNDRDHLENLDGLWTLQDINTIFPTQYRQLLIFSGRLTDGNGGVHKLNTRYTRISWHGKRLLLSGNGHHLTVIDGTGYHMNYKKKV